MYVEDELYYELTGSVKKTGQAVKSVVDMARSFSNMIENSAKNVEVSEMLPISDSSFVFTGQSTDLRFFTKYPEMSISMIENISDENLKNAVKEEFNKAALSGKITVSAKTGRISITPLGKEFISKPEFRMAAAADYDNVMRSMEQTMGFELEGTVQDLGFFNHAETLDLTAIMSHSDKETLQKILENMVRMKKDGLITVEGSIVKLTEKGGKLIQSEAFKAAEKGIVSKAAAATTVSGKIFVAIKSGVKLFSSTLQQK